MYKREVIILLFLLCHILPARTQCRSEGNMIASVSVITHPDRSEQTLISWNIPSGLPSGAAGYIIYKYVGPPYCANAIGTVYDRNATSYTCNGFHPGGYTIAVYNGAAQPGSLQQEHVPPIIHTATYDSCNYTVSLAWSPYVGWDEPDIIYHLYAIIDGQPQRLAGHITGTSFLWQDAPDNKEIAFYVQAVRAGDAGVTSNSPYKYVTATTVQRPAFIDLSHLYYDGREVRLNFRIDPRTALTQFEVQRAAGDVFETRKAFSDKTLVTFSESAESAFRYRLAVKNDCGRIARVSDTLQHFILAMSPQYDAWQLQWNRPVSGDPYTFSLYRRDHGVAPLISNVTYNAFSDPLMAVHNRQSLKYCYRLEAVAPQGESVSETCTFYRPRLAMPDAVNPFSTLANPQTGRARNQFGPVTNAHPATYAYRLTIINRNGAKIAGITKDFDDNPLEKSWNGCFADGAAVPAEAYTYYIEIQFEGGYTENLTGPLVVMYE
jgi:hypothetical protein